MSVAIRPFTATSLAVLCATMIIPAPQPAAPPGAPAPPVQLAAGFDALTPWVQTLDQALTNVTNLVTESVTPPLPLLQQVVVNQIGYLQEFVTDPSAIVDIIGAIWGNLVAAVTTPWEYFSGSLDSAHQTLFALLSPFLDPEWLDLLDFLASPVSGVLLGTLGMVASPWLELRDSVDATIGAIHDGDAVGALNEIVNIPAQMTDGFLNGYGPVDLTEQLAPILPDLPIGRIGAVGVELGGLLSPGGSVFNAVGIDVGTTIFGRWVSAPGFPADGNLVGPLGSLIDLGHAITEAIGWDGVGNPIAALLDP